MSGKLAAAGTDAEKYDVLDKIGCGSFGVIRKVKRRTDGEILCRKEIQYIKMSQKEREQLHAEFSILSSLRHPNIVAYYHREHLKPIQELHLYMEYCGGGDLGQVIHDLKARNQVADESFVWSILSQLCLALYRCHYGEDPPPIGDNVMLPPKRKTTLRSKSQVTVLHRDLKPENVFLGEDGAVKLGDFGLSKLMQSHDFASTYVGTPFYMSPEICAAELYNTHSDIWSLGCIIYELCAKQPPFNAKTHFHLVQKIKEGQYEPLPASYSPELQLLVKRCLNTNPLKRPDTWDLLQLPVIRLMRKQREVVELGRDLKIREQQALEKQKEAEQLLANLDKDLQAARADLDDTVRREWEVKARLEIDRQVELEKERLQSIFEAELQRRVEEGVQQALQKLSLSQQSSEQSSAPNLSTVSTAPSTEGPQTDDSSLLTSYHMLQDSPASSLAPLSQPPKRTTRTPFARARTQVDSPADVMMVSPSPATLDSLNLSPRRAAALRTGDSGSSGAAGHGGYNSGNIFAQAKSAQARWQPQTLYSDSDSEPEDAFSLHADYSAAAADSDADQESDTEIPDLSPTRLPRRGRQANGIADPFKEPRPAMARQRTVPARQPVPQPVLFTSKVPRSKSPVSPMAMRRRPPLAKAVTQGDDMLRAVHNRNLNTLTNNGFGSGNNHGATNGGAQMTAAPPAASTAGFTTTFTAPLTSNVGGRTLVELQQARAGLDPAQVRANNAFLPPKKTASGMENEVACWDSEADEEMPSPFLCRVKRDMTVR